MTKCRFQRLTTEVSFRIKKKLADKIILKQIKRGSNARPTKISTEQVLLRAGVFGGHCDLCYTFCSHNGDQINSLKSTKTRNRDKNSSNDFVLTAVVVVVVVVQGLVPLVQREELSGRRDRSELDQPPLLTSCELLQRRLHPETRERTVPALNRPCNFRTIKTRHTKFKGLI